MPPANQGTPADQPMEERDPEKAKCISCTRCYKAGLEGLGIGCKVERRLKEMAEGVQRHDAAEQCESKSKERRP